MIDESILTSTKTKLGMPEDYNYFDQEVIGALNASFLILNQLGVGTENVFHIEDDTAVWSDFIAPTNPSAYTVREYCYLKARQQVDPPTASVLKDSINALIAEYEWRMMESNESYNN